MKKIFFVATGLLLFGIAPHVLADSGFVPLAGIPGLTQNVQATPAGLAGFFNNLYKYLIGLAAILAVIEIIWGGLEYSTQDSVSKKSDGKKRIYQAIFGLVLVLSPVLVFSIINPSILNLSLNIPKLDTTAAPAQTATQMITQDVTLSATDKALQESAGGKVIFSFIITPAEATQMTPKQLGQTLDAKQDQCTQQAGGVLLSPSSTGGGGLTYICQTCPPNTTVILSAKGIAGSGSRGSCRQN